MDPQTTNKKHPFVVIIPLILVVCFFLVIIFKLSPKQNLSSPVSNHTVPVSKNIATPSQSVHTIDGKIQSVADKSITVSLLSANLSNKGPFLVTVGGRTTITLYPIGVDYAFKKSTDDSKGEALTVKDLRVGQTVAIISSSDLRLMTGDQFEAAAIQVITPVSVLNGVIKSISANNVDLKVISVNSINSTDIILPKNYTVSFSSATEFASGTPDKPIKISSSQLKSGDHIIVFTGADIHSQTSVDALKINLLSQ